MSIRLAACLAVVIATSTTLAETTDAPLAAQPVTTLDGKRGTIALDPVRGGILVLGFSRQSNPQAREWSLQLGAKSAEQRRHGVPLYNVIGLVGAPRLVRGLIRRGIRSGVPEEYRSTFYIVEEDDAFWRALAAVDDDSPAYVLRLNPKGVVCARHVGPANEQDVVRILEASCDDSGGAP